MWKNIEINIQNIEYDTGKAMLIKMPNESGFQGYKFWYPSKLINDWDRSYAICLSFKDDFTFKLKKYGKGKYNSKKIINEITISAEEFAEEFKIMSENICLSDSSYLIVEEPKKVDKEIKIEEDLKND